MKASVNVKTNSEDVNQKKQVLQTRMQKKLYIQLNRNLPGYSEYKHF